MSRRAGAEAHGLHAGVGGAGAALQRAPASDGASLAAELLADGAIADEQRAALITTDASSALPEPHEGEVRHPGGLQDDGDGGGAASSVNRG